MPVLQILLGTDATVPDQPADDGRETFAPSRKMLQTTHPESWLRGYFHEREPEARLLLDKEE